MKPVIIITQPGFVPKLKRPMHTDHDAVLDFAAECMKAHPGLPVCIVWGNDDGEITHVDGAKEALALREDMRAHPYPGDPPCSECGAMTPAEAETKCLCGGDRDHCHGCDLWPDH